MHDHSSLPDASLRIAWKRGALVCVLATLLAGVVCLAFFITWVLPRDSTDAATAWPFLAAFVVYVGAVAVGSTLHERRRWGHVVGWLSDRSATGHQGRQIVLREPWRQATSTFWVWAGGSCIFAGLDLSIVGSPARTSVLLTGAIIGGGYVGALVYLLAERFSRPLVQIALAAGEAPAIQLSVRARMRLAWIAGSGMPLIGVAHAIAWDVVEPDAPDMSAPLLALVGTGLLAGWLLIGEAGRSVADPIEDVRNGLARVRAGDLDVEVDVDQATEIGSLQASFNHMVAGLRDASRTRDLFGRQVGDAVARHAIERGLDFDGQMVEATVLFVDLIGSTSMVQTRSAPEVMRLLNTMFTAVVEATEAEGGWVNKFQGDGALCAFGPPDGRADHAARALRTAVALQRRLAELAETDPGLDVGIGVSTGVVVAGHMGAKSRFEYGVVGDAANEAARLSDAAKEVPGRILVASQTIAAAGPAGEGWQTACQLRLRGRTQLTTAYGPPPAADQAGANADPPSILRTAPVV